MNDPLPEGPFDFAWCRWVLCFVSNPDLLVKKLADVMRKGGRAIFSRVRSLHDLAFFPQRTSLVEFRAHVIATWRESAAIQTPGCNCHRGQRRTDLRCARLCREFFVFSQAITCGSAVAIHSCPSFAIAGNSAASTARLQTKSGSTSPRRERRSFVHADSARA